jgi:adenylate kinase
MKNIIFIAPPAAGKGTQSKLVSALYNIPHISTGDLLREEVSKGTDLGSEIKEKLDNGIFVSDDLILELIKKRINESDCGNGYILDGYPRNVEQALAYDNLLKELGKDLGVVIYMDIDKYLALERMRSRVVCSNCGASYNLMAVKPKVDGICDRCGQELKSRKDDNEETFLSRFNTYMEKTSNLIDYYQEKGVLESIKIEKEMTPEDIFERIKEIVSR